MTIGDRVRTYRINREMSLSELAKKADVAKSYLSSIERNVQQNPSITFVKKVSEALHVSVDHILQDELEMNKVDPEYVDLIKEAVAIGVTKKDLTEFIEFQKWKKRNIK
ncbi:helix-turn-helix domain-containing protein [Mangrovibacillus cuniculi]|uniref:Helix-turn-helix domain-containing protein n=1 Tax=Mangrovibacillus cuniculi TaxID=2593652 RepID=A0A7S8CCX1_9BACI|nr:helix-turn-helix domain-containing protein [Mangrovibacillus cuniculi]QPC47684.1 helix-turn-helix domain-containing protein [Mangrovibacillus cuniculi]